MPQRHSFSLFGRQSTPDTPVLVKGAGDSTRKLAQGLASVEPAAYWESQAKVYANN